MRGTSRKSLSRATLLVLAAAVLAIGCGAAEDRVEVPDRPGVTKTTDAGVGNKWGHSS